MKAKDLMRRDVVTCRHDVRLDIAARAMRERDCGAVPVVDRDGRLVGMITDRDICMAALTKGKRLDEILVEPVMTNSPRYCRPDDSIAEVLLVMREGQVRRFPIVQDERRVVGIISMNDLARQADRELTGAVQQQVGTGAVMRTLATICAHQRQSAVQS